MKKIQIILLIMLSMIANSVLAICHEIRGEVDGWIYIYSLFLLVIVSIYVIVYGPED